LNIGGTAMYDDINSSGYSGVKHNPFSLSFNAGKNFFKEKMDVQLSLNPIYSRKIISNVNTESLILHDEIINKKLIPINIHISFYFGSFKVKPIKETRKKAILNDEIN
jgi:hypothetical protein